MSLPSKKLWWLFAVRSLGLFPAHDRGLKNYKGTDYYVDLVVATAGNGIVSVCYHAGRSSVAGGKGTGAVCFP